MKNTKRALVETDGAHKNSSSKVLKTAQSASGVKAQAWDPLDCEPVIVTATAAEVRSCAAEGGILFADYCRKNFITLVNPLYMLLKCF